MFVSSSFCASCCTFLREHDLFGLRHRFGRPCRLGSVTAGTCVARLAGGRQHRARPCGIAARRSPRASRDRSTSGVCFEQRRRRRRPPAHRASAPPVPGSSSTSSTGSGAGCGSAASVNSSLLGPSRVSSCTDSSGTSRVVFAADVERRADADQQRCRWNAAEMAREVAMSRWVVRNAVQNVSAARRMASAASRCAMANAGEDTRDLRDLLPRPYLAPSARVRSRNLRGVYFGATSARSDRRSAAARGRRAAGGPRISVKIGFRASAQTWYALGVRCSPSCAMPSRRLVVRVSELLVDVYVTYRLCRRRAAAICRLAALMTA